MHVRNCFFSSRYSSSVTGEGFYQCFCDAVKFVGVDNCRTKLIGLGCDGAAANMCTSRGLHRFLKEDVSLVTVSW